ncbi:hypothetical protein CVT24_004803 [Panaeolus cyanescens]|uniref:Uncharacterized protein n=1 Tax=Panaeolus cyanescens TaxID=181874 RepID=A0A409WYK9_9AGAR|nr:hypothetical protein CVT24_004803 [Panaeolus cyanescens]
MSNAQRTPNPTEEVAHITSPRIIERPLMTFFFTDKDKAHFKHTERYMRELRQDIYKEQKETKVLNAALQVQRDQIHALSLKNESAKEESQSLDLEYNLLSATHRDLAHRIQEVMKQTDNAKRLRLSVSDALSPAQLPDVERTSDGPSMISNAHEGILQLKKKIEILSSDVRALNLDLHHEQ